MPFLSLSKSILIGNHHSWGKSLIFTTGEVAQTSKPSGTSELITLTFGFLKH